MFRKIHSNRDPRDTVWTELRREFGPRFGKAKTQLAASANNHSRFLFWMMVVNILLSAILSFTVFRHPVVPPVKKPVKVFAPIAGGVNDILQASYAISEMMRLRKAIDSLSAKKQMNARDSLTLERALDRFQQLNKNFNRK